MRTITKILDVEIQPTAKGDIAMLTLKSPGAREAMTIRMFSKDVEQGRHTPFIQAVGSFVVTDIDVGLYNGSLQYRLGYNAQCVTYDTFIRKESMKLQQQKPHSSKVS